MQKPPKPETEPSEGTRRIPRQDPGRCHGHPTGRRASACSHAARVRGGGGGWGLWSTTTYIDFPYFL